MPRVNGVRGRNDLVVFGVVRLKIAQGHGEQRALRFF